MNDMNQQNKNTSSNDFALSHSFSRRQMVINFKKKTSFFESFFFQTMMNSCLDPSISPEPTSTLTTNPHCAHCGKYYCQIDFIFSCLSRYGNSNDQQYVVDQRIQEIISK